jgi:hypothetical protein
MMAQQSGEDPHVYAPSLADDSGIDAGDAGQSHGDNDQDNHGHHLLQAQTESDENSTDTDEG